MKDNGIQFEDDVTSLLELRGYKVQKNVLISGTQIDILAKIDDPLDNLCYVVECTNRKESVGIELVKQKASVLFSIIDKTNFYRLMFVSQNGFTNKAKLFAGDNQNQILLLTYNELENQLINFKPYYTTYIYEYKESIGIFKEGKLYQNYVELTGKDEFDQIIPNLTNKVLECLTTGSNNLIFLLGEYGSGKTSFCRQLVFKLINEKLAKNETSFLIPILINLREYRNAFNIQQVITDTLINQYLVKMTSFNVFERYCTKGRILLILDGFDEMADRSDKRAIINCFQQIFILANLNTKIVLTCRSNFFKSHSDVVNLFNNFSIKLPIQDEKKEKIIELTFEHQGRIINVEKFSQKQIRQYIAKRFGTDSESIFVQIKGIHDLSDLCSRPVLLDMILTTLPELVDAEIRINSAALYEYYTNKWTSRDDWRVIMPLRMRQNFCEILAWIMYNTKIQEIKYPLLEKAMIKSLENLSLSDGQLENFKNDIQTCSFLVRIDKNDRFRFAHKSFIEFFVAKKLIYDLLKGIEISKPDTNDWIAANKDKSTITDNKDNKIEIEKRAFKSHNTSLLGYITPSPLPITHEIQSLYQSSKSMLADLMHLIDMDKHTFASLYEPIEIVSDSKDESENQLKEHFEKEIREIFKTHDKSKLTEDLGVTEEIATFAIEYLETSNVELKELIDKLSNNKALSFFCDLLRLSKAREFIRSNQSFMIEYLKVGEEELLKTSFCIALLNIDDLIDIEFVDYARENLSPNSYHYFLFELASKDAKYDFIFKGLLSNDEVSSVEKILSFYSLNRKPPKSITKLIDEGLVIDLLKSDDVNEIKFGLCLCEVTTLPAEHLFHLLIDIIKNCSVDEVKQLACSIISELDISDSYDWKKVRMLWNKEKDTMLKRSLKNLENNLRDIYSLKKNRINWSEARSDKMIRDKLWNFVKI